VPLRPHEHTFSPPPARGVTYGTFAPRPTAQSAGRPEAKVPVMPNSLDIPRRALAALVAACALIAIALPAASASAKTTPVTGSAASINYCKYENTPLVKLKLSTVKSSVSCLINKQRKAAGLVPLVRKYEVYVGKSAQRHADISAQQKFWTTWQSSHMEPGAAGDFGAQITQRIRSTGFCPTGSWRTAEITFTQSGGATPGSAVTWWMNDPPHRATILDGGLRASGIGFARGTAQSGLASQTSAGTFVVDFGTCNGSDTSV
jgi:uncharacterized protein YkwD